LLEGLFLVNLVLDCITHFTLQILNKIDLAISVMSETTFHVNIWEKRLSEGFHLRISRWDITSSMDVLAAERLNDELNGGELGMILEQEIGRLHSTAHR